MMIVPADWIKALHLIWFASSSTIPILFSRAWLMPEARRACTTGCLLQIVPFPSSQDSIPIPFQVVCHSGSNKGDLHFLNTCWKHNGQKPRALNLDLMLRDAREWHKPERTHVPRTPDADFDQITQSCLWYDPTLPSLCATNWPSIESSWSIPATCKCFSSNTLQTTSLFNKEIYSLNFSSTNDNSKSDLTAMVNIWHRKHLISTTDPLKPLAESACLPANTLLLLLTSCKL